MAAKQAGLEMDPAVMPVRDSLDQTTAPGLDPHRN